MRLDEGQGAAGLVGEVVDRHVEGQVVRGQEGLQPRVRVAEKGFAVERGLVAEAGCRRVRGRLSGQRFVLLFEHVELRARRGADLDVGARRQVGEAAGVTVVAVYCGLTLKHKEEGRTRAGVAARAAVGGQRGQPLVEVRAEAFADDDVDQRLFPAGDEAGHKAVRGEQGVPRSDIRPGGTEGRETNGFAGADRRWLGFVGGMAHGYLFIGRTRGSRRLP